MILEKTFRPILASFVGESSTGGMFSFGAAKAVGESSDTRRNGRADDLLLPKLISKANGCFCALTRLTRGETLRAVFETFLAVATDKSRCRIGRIVSGVGARGCWGRRRPEGAGRSFEESGFKSSLSIISDGGSNCGSASAAVLTFFTVCLRYATVEGLIVSKTQSSSLVWAGAMSRLVPLA